MNVETILQRKENQLNGVLSTDVQISELRGQLSQYLSLDWYISLLQNFRLSGSCFSLDEENDQSGLGVELEWLSPEKTINEALYSYPGKAVIDMGYLPIGSCLIGSGDPYFLELKDNSKDPAVVRVPHEIASYEEYSKNSFEMVCNSLHQFFERADFY